MGVFESDLDIYLTNSACVGLRMLGFRFEQGIIFNSLFHQKKGLLTFWEGFLSWAEGAFPNSQKALFPPKQTYEK